MTDDEKYAEARREAEAFQAKMEAAVTKHAGLRAKILAALNQDADSREIDYLLVGATKATCLIKKPMVMMEGNDIPDFDVYHDWKQRIEIVLAPNKAKRKAYLTLFPDAEAIN